MRITFLAIRIKKGLVKDLSVINRFIKNIDRFFMLKSFRRRLYRCDDPGNKKGTRHSKTRSLQIGVLLELLI